MSTSYQRNRRGPASGPKLLAALAEHFRREEGEAIRTMRAFASAILRMPTEEQVSALEQHLAGRPRPRARPARER